MIRAVVFAVVICLMVQFFKKEQPSWSFLIALAGILIITGWAMEWASEIIRQSTALFALTDINGMTEVLKCMGIALIGQLAEAICKDAGQSALGSIVEFTGRLLILFAIMPVFREVLAEVLRLLQ